MAKREREFTAHESYFEEKKQKKKKKALVNHKISSSANFPIHRTSDFTDFTTILLTGKLNGSHLRDAR